MHNRNEGWVRIPKRTNRSRFDKYKNEMFVLVTTTKSGARIFLTDKVLETLEAPDFIAVNRRSGSSSLALEKVESDADGFHVVYNKREGFESATPYISINSIARTYDLKPGAYEAYERHGMVVFDTADTPSTF